MNKYDHQVIAMALQIITLIGSVAYVVHVAGERIYTFYPMWFNIVLIGLLFVVISGAGYYLLEGVIKSASLRKK